MTSRQREPAVCDPRGLPTPAARPRAALRLPRSFAPPSRVTVPYGHHLRPVRESDVDLDLVAVMGSQARLWRIYGWTRGWPSAAMTRDQHRADLARREQDMARQVSFTYALLDTDETALLGRLAIDPPTCWDADADVSWWVVDECVGTDLAIALDALVPRWIDEHWPFHRPRYAHPPAG